MNGLPHALTLAGLRIIESSAMVVHLPPVRVRRTWPERLLSWPWRPWRAHRWHPQTKPSPEVIATPDGLVMHPATARELREAIKVQAAMNVTQKLRPMGVVDAPCS
jgi:hypothetical protein